MTLQIVRFNDVVRDVSGGNAKLPQSEFQPSGKLAIVDQGQRFIAGYTDDMTCQFRSDSLPVVVFGDHTKAIKYIDFPFAMGADGVKVLKATDECDSKYLYHFLRQAKIPDAGYSRHFKFLKELEIPLPPLPEQRRIAAILDKADALRAKRREAIAKLGQLLQSVFLEMFGDPVTNPKGWPRLTFADLVRVKSGNGLTAQEMSPDGVYNVYGGNGVSGRHSEYMFEDPQIVIGRVGAYCGAVHRTEPKSWITDNALFVSQVLRPMNPRFLQEILSVANFNQYAGRAAQPLVSGSRIYPVETILPPISLQDEYASRIELILREMAKMSSHRHALEAMFSSLQHRSFAGAL